MSQEEDDPGPITPLDLLRFHLHLAEPTLEGGVPSLDELADMRVSLAAAIQQLPHLQALEQRIAKALEYAKDGGFDGAHHKMWVIDQLVRALTGCPLVERTKQDHRGQPLFTYEAQGESDEYRAWVGAYCDGEDGPHTYAWDEGVPP